jgi:Rho-binding antiterminator
MENPYNPIDCNFYDYFLDASTRKLPSEIRYWEAGNEVVLKNAIITDVFTRQGEEFLLTNTALIIRLDQVISLNGRYLVNTQSACKVC